ncbi:MAG: hypothetical protein ACXVB0_21345 [Mucilaginibacter sp.]
MKIVRVQYTAKPEYVAKNKANITKVMNDLRAINNPGLKYSTYLLDDGKTFMHFTHFENDEAHQVLRGLESFKIFQSELKASGPETAPKAENLSLVASSYDLFR